MHWSGPYFFFFEKKVRTFAITDLPSCLMIRHLAPAVVACRSSPLLLVHLFVYWNFEPILLRVLQKMRDLSLNSGTFRRWQTKTGWAVVSLVFFFWSMVSLVFLRNKGDMHSALFWLAPMRPQLLVTEAWRRQRHHRVHARMACFHPAPRRRGSNDESPRAPKLCKQAAKREKIHRPWQPTTRMCQDQGS